MPKKTKATPYRLFVAAFFAVAVAVFSGYKLMASNDLEENPTSITILASTSLTDVMSELIRIYSRKKGFSVAVVYGPPNELIETVKEGESADFFIAEDQEGMLDLKQRGLIDVFTISNIAQNRLVLTASTDHYLSRFVNPDMALPRLFSDLNEKVLLVMGDPDEVPVGNRARQAIENLGYWQGIGPYIVRTQSASSAKYLIAKGRSAGITYYTDAFGSNEMKILSELPKNLYSPIVYQAAVVAGVNMPLARNFLDYLKTAEAKAVFSRYGFDVN